MLNDKMYRQFLSTPFDQAYQGSQKVTELRETLLIDQILKCGKDILGTIGIEIDGQQIGASGQDQMKDRKKQKQQLRNSYIYKHEYGKGLSKQYRNDPEDSMHEEISFTLSSEENPRQNSSDSRRKNSSGHVHFSPETSANISWKKMLTEGNTQQSQPQYITDFIQSQLSRPDSNQKVGKWKKPTQLKKDSYSSNKLTKYKRISPQKIEVESPIRSKDSLGRKTFQLNKSKMNYFTESAKQRKPIFEGKNSPKKKQQNTHLSYSTYNPYPTNATSFHTPEKYIRRVSEVPLSQQITKNVYGRMKDQVNAKSFIKEFEFQERKRQQESDEIWKNFINRSDKWIENKKSHLIQRKAQKNFFPFHYLTRPADSPSPQKPNASYIELKVNQQNDSRKLDWLQGQGKKFQPQVTFKIGKMQEDSPKKRQSSVQNCINKLKTQTQLLKVKLLSPLKKQINDYQTLDHYKELNYPENRRLVRKFSSKQEGESQKILKNMPGFSYIKNVYGNCIGNQGSEQKNIKS